MISLWNCLRKVTKPCDSSFLSSLYNEPQFGRKVPRFCNQTFRGRFLQQILGHTSFHITENFSSCSMFGGYLHGIQKRGI